MSTEKAKIVIYSLAYPYTTSGYQAFVVALCSLVAGSPLPESIPTCRCFDESTLNSHVWSRLYLISIRFLGNAPHFQLFTLIFSWSCDGLLVLCILRLLPLRNLTDLITVSGRSIWMLVFFSFTFDNTHSSFSLSLSLLLYSPVAHPRVTIQRACPS